MVANPARGQLNWRNEHSLSSFAPETWSRQTGSAVPSRASLLISTLRLNRVLLHGKPPAFRDGIHLHPFTYTVNRHTPSYRSRVYQVTQLRYGVHCRESVGTGLVLILIVKVVEFPQRVLPFQVSPWTNFRAPLFSHTL